MFIKEDALKVTHGQTLYHLTLKNSDNTPVRARVNGICKTWKKDLNKFQLPVKHGLKTCFYITEENGKYWSINEEDANFHPIKNTVDREKFAKLTGELPNNFICTTCKKTYEIVYNKRFLSSHKSYAVIGENYECECLSCNLVKLNKLLKDQNKITLYLKEPSKDETDKYYDSIPNSKIVIREKYYELSTSIHLVARSYRFYTTKHNWGGKRLHLWFRDIHGTIWYGFNIGDNDIVYCRKTKMKRF